MMIPSPDPKKEPRGILWLMAKFPFFLDVLRRQRRRGQKVQMLVAVPRKQKLKRPCLRLRRTVPMTKDWAVPILWNRFLLKDRMVRFRKNHSCLVFSKTGNTPVSQLRSAHMKSHHPGHYNGAVASHLRDYFPAVEASTDIPEDQRAWTCAFCPKALPQLKSQHAARAKKESYQGQTGSFQDWWQSWFGWQIESFCRQKKAVTI